MSLRGLFVFMAEPLLIFVSREDEALLSRIREVAPDVEIVNRGRLDEDPELLGRIGMVYGGLKTKELERASSLRWLQTTSAGVNSLLSPALQESELIVTNASGIHAAPIAEQMFGMVLVVTRGLHRAWEAQGERAWKQGEVGAGLSLLSGKTLGVLGVGAIGGHAARIGQAFGMTVVGLRHSGEAHPHVETMYTDTDEDRAAFLGRCDVVMNTLPETKATKGFLGETEFAALKRGAIIVNAGRGATIDTEALLGALSSGQVSAACLDVTDPEPLPSDHPLWTTSGVFITPHTSGSRPDYDERADDIFIDNLRRFLSGEELENVVDKTEGY